MWKSPSSGRSIRNHSSTNLYSSRWRQKFQASPESHQWALSSAKYLANKEGPTAFQKKLESRWRLWYAELGKPLRPFLLFVQPLGQECARVMGLAMWANDGRPTGGANYLSLRISACAITQTCDERRRRRQSASLLKLEWQTSKSSPN